MRATTAVMAGLALAPLFGCHGAAKEPARVPAGVTVRFPEDDRLEWSVRCLREGKDFLALGFLLANRSDQRLGVPLEMGVYSEQRPGRTPGSGLEGSGPVVIRAVTRPDGTVFWTALWERKRGPRPIKPEDLHWVAPGATFRPPEIRVPAQALGIQQRGTYVLLFAVQFPLYYMDLSPLGHLDEQVWGTGESWYFALPLTWE